MHNAAGDRVEIEPGNRNDTYPEVVSTSSPSSTMFVRA
jgi:hypothetical protein